MRLEFGRGVGLELEILLVDAVDVAVVQPEGRVEGGRRYQANHLCARLPAAEAPQSHVRRPVRGRIEGEA